MNGEIAKSPAEVKRGKPLPWTQLQSLCFPSVQLGGRGRTAASQRRWMGGSKQPTERKRRWTAGRGREKCMAAHIASDRVTDEDVDTFHSGHSLSACLHDPSKTPVTPADGQNYGSRKYSLFRWNISLKWPQYMLNAFTAKQCLIHLLRRSGLVKRGTFFLLPTWWELQLDSLVHFSVPELAAETLRSSSNLKGNLIKSPKCADHQMCTTVCVRANTRLRILMWKPHVWVCLSVSAAALASVYRCDSNQHVCEVKAE